MIQKTPDGHPYLVLRGGRKHWFCPGCERTPVGEAGEVCRRCETIRQLQDSGMEGCFVRTDAGSFYVPRKPKETP